MIREDNGQVSLEYLLIFTISLIILMIFTLPLTELAIENTMDISDSLDVKSDLSKISQTIEQVYGEGQGSKHTVDVSSKEKIKIVITDKYAYCNLKLKDNKIKQITEYYDSNIKKTSIILDGENSLVVEWPINSENMLIYRK